MKPVREWSVFAQVLAALVAFVVGIPILIVLILVGLANASAVTVLLAVLVVPPALIYSAWDKRRRAAR